MDLHVEVSEFIIISFQWFLIRPSIVSREFFILSRALDKAFSTVSAWDEAAIGCLPSILASNKHRISFIPFLLPFSSDRWTSILEIWDWNRSKASATKEVKWLSSLSSPLIVLSVLNWIFIYPLFICFCLFFSKSLYSSSLKIYQYFSSPLRPTFPLRSSNYNPRTSNLSPDVWPL